MRDTRASMFAVLAFVCLCEQFALVTAHDSCCARGASAVAGPTPEMIPDMSKSQPEGWDEDEDGPWERPLIPKPPPSTAERFRVDLQNQLLDACPWLLLGLLCSGSMQMVVPLLESMQRQLSGGGVGVIAKGTVMGLMSPLCSCGVLPMAVSLANVGAAPAAIVSYIISSQSAGVDSLVFTIGVLGTRAAALRMFAAGFLALCAGAVVPSRQLTAAKRRKDDSSTAQTSTAQRIVSGLRAALTDDFDEVVPPVAFGFVATAAINAVTPPGGLAKAAILGGAVGRAVVLGIAIPLQFCEHASVPLTVALRNAGASGGLAFSVLTTLPSVNIGSLTAIAKFAGVSSAVKVTLAVWTCGLAMSYAADFGGVDLGQVGHSSEALPDWYIAASRWVVGCIFILSIFRQIRSWLGHGVQDSCCSTGKDCKND